MVKFRTGAKEVLETSFLTAIQPALGTERSVFCWIGSTGSKFDGQRAHRVKSRQTVGRQLS